MSKQNDISKEAVSLGRILDRKQDGLYFIVLDKTSKATPDLGWDITIYPMPHSERIALMRQLSPLDKKE